MHPDGAAIGARPTGFLSALLAEGRPLTTTILVAVLLGSFAGLVPGPYTTMVAGTGLERGLRPALKLALAPLVTDIPPLLVTAFVLERLSGTALSALGVVGGVIIAVVGIRFLRRHRPDPRILESLEDGDDDARPEQSATFTHVVLGTLLSPAPWIFWLVVASPFMLRSWNRSSFEGALFVVLLFATNIGTASGLAWLASRGRRLLAGPWLRRILRVAGVGLLAAGALLVWQALAGNFEALIRQQETVRSIIEEQTG